MGRYTEDDRRKDAQANAFANALLMPREMFVSEYQKIKHLQEEDRVKSLAKIFDVPDWAVVNRLRELKKDLL